MVGNQELLDAFKHAVENQNWKVNLTYALSPNSDIIKKEVMI